MFKSKSKSTNGQLSSIDEGLTKQFWNKILTSQLGQQYYDKYEANLDGKSTSGGGTTDTKNSSQKNLWEHFALKITDLYLADHPDKFLSRFLISGKLDVNEAYKKLTNAMKYYDEIDLNKIKELGEPSLPEYPLKSGLLHYFGYSKQGNVLIWYNIDTQSANKQSLDALIQYTLYQLHLGALLSKGRGVTVAVDASKFGLSNAHYSFWRSISVLFNDYLPHLVLEIVVINPPMLLFGVWNLIKPFFDHSISNAVQFIKLNELNKYIDESQIPKHLGGKADFKYSYTPPQGEEAKILQDTAAKEVLMTKRAELHEKFIRATVQWIQGNETDSERDQLAQDLSNNYRELCPYIWSSSLLHRQGVITNCDEVDFSKCLNKV